MNCPLFLVNATNILASSLQKRLKIFSRKIESFVKTTFRDVFRKKPYAAVGVARAENVHKKVRFL